MGKNEQYILNEYLKRMEIIKGIQVDIPFECFYEWQDGEKETWEGNIDRIIQFGSHVEFHITSRSGFNVIVGEYTNGVFMVIESDGGGVGLANPQDIFYNKEKITRYEHINTVDGVTAVYALKALDTAGYFPKGSK